MNEAVVEKWFSRYPKLETISVAGTVSLKAARDILLIDRFDMYNIYLELLEAQAIRASGNSCFRATPELKAFIAAKAATNADE